MILSGGVTFGLFLTALAGLSTGVGSAMAFFARRTNKAFLSAVLGFSGGVMIYVSFIEILPVSCEALVKEHGVIKGNWLGVSAFFAGMILTAILDRLVPSVENPHEIHSVEEMSDHVSDERLMRMGLITALAIGLHNFPEGLATFLAAMSDPFLGISVTVAVALHNIPEGIAVSVPVFFATGSRKKAFWYSFFSGISEPVGALLGWLILKPFFTPTVFGLTFGAVAGIMIFISIDELLPTALEYGRPHVSVYGIIAGMGIMAISLLLFNAI